MGIPGTLFSLSSSNFNKDTRKIQPGKISYIFSKKEKCSYISENGTF